MKITSRSIVYCTLFYTQGPLLGAQILKRGRERLLVMRNAKSHRIEVLIHNSVFVNAWSLMVGPHTRTLPTLYVRLYVRHSTTTTTTLGSPTKVTSTQPQPPSSILFSPLPPDIELP